jgi:hypothetical protein
MDYFVRSAPAAVPLPTVQRQAFELLLSIAASEGKIRRRR